MIINIRGTSGSGKTTLVRKFMEKLGSREPIFIEGRKRPIGYKVTSPSRGDIVVLGHYETACGGADTITSFDQLFALAKQYAAGGFDVIFEGLLSSADFRRTAELKDFGLLVIALDVPLDVCLASVNARRHARNPELPPVNPKNTESKYKSVKLCMKRFAEAEIPCELLTREEAARRLEGLLL